jgi:hypothetical protein
MNGGRLLRRLASIALTAPACAGAAGCVAPREKLVVSNPDPSVKIPAIKVAIRQNDLGAAEQLVKDLESDDPAVRFYAIEGLRRLTDQDLGYRYYEPEPEQRKPAVERWRGWLAGQRGAASSNGSNP